MQNLEKMTACRSFFVLEEVLGDIIDENKYRYFLCKVNIIDIIDWTGIFCRTIIKFVEKHEVVR